MVQIFDISLDVFIFGINRSKENIYLIKMSTPQGSGIYIVTDGDQEKLGLYKVSKTPKIETTMIQLNAARAFRDFKIIKFFPCGDLKQLEEFVSKALKKLYISGSKEWIKVDETSLTKICNTIESLADIVNDS